MERILLFEMADMINKVLLPKSYVYEFKKIEFVNVKPFNELYKVEIYLN